MSAGEFELVVSSTELALEFVFVDDFVGSEIIPITTNKPSTAVTISFMYAISNCMSNACNISNTALTIEIQKL